MSADAEKIARLVHAVRTRQPLAHDLAPWLAGHVLGKLSAPDRVAARDAALRQAAALRPGGRWAKMTAVRDELAAVRDELTLHVNHPPQPETFTALIFTALSIDPNIPSSISQLLRILKDDDD